MLRCLERLYALRIVHCDLKPENVLLRKQGYSSIKVIDFGTSFIQGHPVYTYVQTRFYRAPEVLLHLPYGHPVDMWSLGGMLAELYTGRPLLPGEPRSDQISLILHLLGTPPKHVLERTTKAIYFTFNGLPLYCRVKTLPDGTQVAVEGSQSPRFKKWRGLPGSRSWSQALNDCKDEHFVHFIKRCLDWDADTRLTPHQALRHPWLATSPMLRLPLPSANHHNHK